ncbi:MAG: C1 family peptidase [Bacteroidales bacterium]|nr:C1 family peptidase [Bacteroidales bacterium]
MKKILTIMMVLALMFQISAIAQKTEKKTPDSGYVFTLTKELPHTGVKNQYRSSTCWSFSALSFFESEMIRMGKGEYDFSDMFCVRDAYEQKVSKYVRMQGNINLAAGGAFHDVMHTIKTRGLMPESAYAGLQYSEPKHVHSEMDNALRAFMDVIIKNPNKKLSTAWYNATMGILNAYLGVVPEKFNYNGKEYTAKSFAAETGLNMDNYLDFGSYTHHPFYKNFILEIPDNWAWGETMNIPLDEMMQIIDNALDKGYTIAWGSDISEKGFAYNKGLALTPETDIAELGDSEKAKWEKLTEKERNSQMYKFDNIITEKIITQEIRQQEFDNYQTTDDHGMHIVGYGHDQTGKKYYYVKNSWGADNKYDGYFYVSPSFMRLKTINILVHKDAVPKDILKKIGK